MEWRTDPPLIGVEIELETNAGKSLTGEVSFVAKGRTKTGRKRYLYMLREGARGAFEVVRWRRVGE